jgi:hypothetical protein
MKLHDFLVEHAKFPFPVLDESQSIYATHVSDFEGGILERQWKAKYAVRDNALVQKLCDSLQKILGDAILAPDSENSLLENVSPRLQYDRLFDEKVSCSANRSEVQVSF